MGDESQQEWWRWCGSGGGGGVVGLLLGCLVSVGKTQLLV